MDYRNSKLAALALAGLLVFAGTVRAAEGESAEDSMEDLRSTLGNVSAQLNDLKSKVDNNVSFGVNTDLRYDYQPYNGFGPGNALHPLAQPYTTPNGSAGMYAKRVELEVKGKFLPSAMWHMQFEFAGLKLEDLGVEFMNVPMGMKGYDFNLKVGQFRQPFGIENQTGSSAIPFSERAIIDGGANPTGGGAKIVFERVMGVHFTHEHSFGPVGYKIQAAVADNVKDQDPGNGLVNASYSVPATPTVSVTAADSLGIKTDQDPTEIGRFGLDLNFIPKIVKLNVGASYIHNSNNSAFFATNSTKQSWSDNLGYDATIEIPAVQSKIWGEWVAQNVFGPATAAVDGTVPLTREEGWYIVDTTKPLALFNKDWTALDLNLRIESVTPNIDTAPNAYPRASSIQASTVGLKYNWAGKNYTSVNYTSFALNGDYSAIGASSLFIVQQQFNF